MSADTLTPEEREFFQACQAWRATLTTVTAVQAESRTMQERHEAETKEMNRRWDEAQAARSAAYSAMVLGGKAAGLEP